ncbi:hypothetical protein ACJMK2_033206 [Sinanodonta woodiana]|uniref:PHD-type domain-containing protein n=1 Tax=Sinanodonta woodiana TaxID=1069815 RepID=A0ABD3X7X1_SINWO
MGITLLGIPTILSIYKILTVILIAKPILNNNFKYGENIISVDETIFQQQSAWIVKQPILSWRGSSTIKLNNDDNLEYFNWHSTSPTTNSSPIMPALILLSGDIEVNPGPPKFPCAICQKAVAMNHNALQCDECNAWVHAKCDSISNEEYKRFENIHSLVFQCPKCRLLTFTDSFFLSSEDSLNMNNTFSPLSETSDGELPLDEVENMSTVRGKANNIRIMTVNCRSLISDKKEGRPPKSN